VLADMGRTSSVDSQADHIVDAPSLAVFKARLDGALRNMI